ncbi:flagellar protein FliT [Bacillus massiliglaciei]|uniref:flagellar protein FliT n=1 Tax=Bacillus massiliglaciei TaxID=1816693 RepID=UPI000DA613A8|nr:flagellar protein FliT [Bacillus massiliglaciei]
MLQDFYRKTVELLHVLKDKQVEREDRITRITQLIDQREKLLSGIQPPFSAEEKQTGSRLIELNQEVDRLLLLEKKAIQRDINGLNKKKNMSNKYANPYRDLSVDGAFYDRRN